MTSVMSRPGRGIDPIFAKRPCMGQSRIQPHLAVVKAG